MTIANATTQSDHNLRAELESAERNMVLNWQRMHDSSVPMVFRHKAECLYLLYQGQVTAIKGALNASGGNTETP